MDKRSGSHHIPFRQPAGETRQTVLPRALREKSGLRLVLTRQKRYSRQMAIDPGGGGEMELALDRDIQRMVVIKRLPRHLHDPESLARFANEIRTIGHLDHPNILPIHDVAVDENNQYYFVMKYVSGRTLRDIINRLQKGDRDFHRIYPFQKRMEVFAEVLRAVDFAHQKGIIHRDLKPENIVIGAFGEIMVMGWGIARPVNPDSPDLAQKNQRQKEITIYKSGIDPRTRIYTDSRQSGRRITIGTPLYMPPEQIDHEPEHHDQQSDIYSLCALFYEFLTLTPPIGPGRTPHQTFQRVIFQKPRPAMRIRHRHQCPPPADLSHFVARGLKKEPSRRYPSVRKMREQLQKIAEGYIPVQCPFTLSKRLIHTLIHLLNRFPVMGVTILATLILLIILGLFYGIQLLL